MPTPCYPADALQSFAAALLGNAGLAPDRAGVVAEVLVEGDLLGHDTHGLALLAGYLEELVQGRMTSHGDYTVLNDDAATALWDGHRLPGPWLVRRAFETARRKADDCGTGTVVIRRSHHIACLAAYLREVAQAGYLGLLASSDPNAASVAPHGGIDPVFTPNPIAAAWPTDQGPVMVDISASITTNGMSTRKRQAGERFAHPWLLDAQGAPSDDPEVLFTKPPGTILPTGGLDHGHKGYALALLIEALTGALAGFGRADPREGWGATVFVQVMRIGAFAGLPGFTREASHVARQALASRPRQPQAPVRLPGLRGLEKRGQQQRSGVALHPGIMPALRPWAERFGLALPSAVADAVM